MAEPDHIFVNPLPNLSYGGFPAAFPFFYIKPEQNEKIVRKFYPEENGPLTNIDPIGNSPVIIKKVTLFFVAGDYFYFHMIVLYGVIFFVTAVVLIFELVTIILVVVLHYLHFRNSISYR